MLRTDRTYQPVKWTTEGMVKAASEAGPVTSDVGHTSVTRGYDSIRRARQFYLFA